MPNTPTIKGLQSVLWGVASAVTGVTGVGIITGAEKGTSADKVEITDENGFVVCVVFFNEKNECSFEMIVKTAAPTLAIGDAITVGAVAFCLVDDMKMMWKQNDVQKMSIKATRYKALTADA
jgi:hypothetical protein